MTIRVCVIMALFAITPFKASWAQSKIDYDLSSRLGAATLAKDGHVSGILVLEEQADIESLQTAFASQKNATTRQERHERVVRALQATAAATQPALMAQLQNMPGVLKAKSLWIVNAIIIDAAPDVFYQLERSTLIQGMYLDYPIQTIAPTEETVSKAPAAVNGEPGLRNINAHLLWAEGITGRGRLVSHLDTGVDGNHPALRNTWRGRRAGVNPRWAWFDPLTNTTAPFDAGRHGTHTMGTIVGRSGTDIIGVAYDADWISAGVIDRGGINATIQNALLAFQWSADPDGNPATVTDVPDVSSNSWGIPLSFRPGCDQTFWQAIDNMEAATVVAVFAAGNEGRNGAQSLRTPADRTTSAINAFSVGSLDTNGSTISSFSSRGPSRCTFGNRIKPEVVARGSSVRSCVPGTGYANLSGTSMATPHVAGAVALLRQVNPNATVAQIKNALMNSATDLGSAGDDNTYGRGRIDVYKAAQLIKPNTCSANLTINQPINTNNNYQASSTITASSAIANAATVNFTAGTRIRLLPGFRKVAANGKFNAKIGPCPTSLATAAEPVSKVSQSLTPNPSFGFEKAFTLHPNPAQDLVTIGYPFEVGVDYTVKVYNYNGKLVQTAALQTPTSQFAQCSLGELDNGLYLVKLILPNGKHKTQRLSIKK